MHHLVSWAAFSLLAFGIAAAPAAAGDIDTCDNGKGDERIAACSGLISVNPKFAGAYNNRGVAYAAKGDYERAIADYDQAIRLDPANGPARRNRARAQAALRARL
jgi:tetratricopeptide (TPR) repeat protein